MNTFNRAFVGLLALGWIAALGAAIWLVWDQSRVVDLASSSVNLNFDIIADTQAERILATIAAAALMLPALFLLAFEMKPSRHRAATAEDSAENRRLQSRVETLERELKEERSRNVSPRDDREVATAHGRSRWNLFPRH